MKRTLKGVIAILVLGLVLLGGIKLLKTHVRETPTQGPATGTAVGTPLREAIEISIASSNAKQDWLHAAVAKFNVASKSQRGLQSQGKPIFVRILQENIDGKIRDYRSGPMVSDTLNQKIKPTIISPGEESWVQKFEKDWQIKYNSDPIKGDSPLLARTPLAILMWESRAKALGCWPKSGPDCTWQRIQALAASPQGWKTYNHPEWGKFTFGYGYYGESNSGTLGITAMCMSGVNKNKGLALADVDVNNGCGRTISGFESAKVHSGKESSWLLDRMVQGGPEYLDAVIAYESNTIAMNRKHGKELREPLVTVYPQDGTVILGHPFTILDNVPWVSEEQVAAAKVFGSFLLSPEQQEAVLNLGLRPADPNTKLASPIEPGFGADPEAKLVLLTLPDTMTSERIGEVWRKVKKKAIIVLLFDKSGSMRENGKIGAAIKGAQAFVDFMELGDHIGWMPFDNVVYIDKGRGTKAAIGEELKGEIASTTANGGTALYKGVLDGIAQLEEFRRKYGDTVRYGMVALSDGKDTSSSQGYRVELSDVESKLKPQESDPRGFQIHTICIGSDCDEQVLKRIAAAAHGKFSKGNTAEDMVKIYRDIGTHY